ncbi:MAG: methyltransferase domain-containing protein [Rhizobiales bacterium]|nr:methyltransferase domain-containing protein [Hyphomicrobiales bacterium]
MTRRLRRWVIIGLLAAVGVVVAIAAARPPYLPVIHGTDDAEVARIAAWLRIEPGTRVADIGAGDGAFALALARRVGPQGHVYATEIDERLLAGMQRAVKQERVENLTVIKAGVSRTNLPDGCCDAVLSRAVYHHLSDHAAINADLFRLLRPGSRLLMIDFEPGGIMNWIGIGHSAEPDRGHGTLKAAMVKEVTAAGFQLARGPVSWRGRTYAVLFTRP